MFSKSGAAQVYFEVTIRSVINLPDTKGPLRIEWKRSSDDGKTKAVSATNNTVNFNDKLEFKSNLFKDNDALANKLILFKLQEKDGKKSITYGKVSVNLSEYVNLQTIDSSFKSSVDLYFPTTGSKSPILKVDIVATILKLKKGSKKLVKIKRPANGKKLLIVKFLGMPVIWKVVMVKLQRVAVAMEVQQKELLRKVQV